MNDYTKIKAVIIIVGIIDISAIALIAMLKGFEAQIVSAGMVAIVSLALGISTHTANSQDEDPPKKKKRK